MSDIEAEQPTASSASGSKTAAISNFVVRLMSEYTGRGPTRARTYFSLDLVTVVLQDTLTRGERSLVGNGKGALVLDMRFAFQQTMREELITGVQDITGREVAAFMSANHLDPDMGIESFVLVPEPKAARAGG